MGSTKARRHLRNCKGIGNKSFRDGTNEAEDQSPHSSTVVGEEASTLSGHAPPPTASAFEFERVESSIFFDMDKQDLGQEHLFSLKFNLGDEVVKDVEKDTADCQMRLARFCLNLSRDQRSELADLHKRTEIILRREWLSEQAGAPVMWPLSIPKTGAEMRNHIVTGGLSVVENLPHPRVKTLKNHAVVSLWDVVAHHLANGLDITDIGPNPEGPDHIEHIGESPMAVEIKARALLRFGTLDDVAVIVLREWSDDFDANNTKDNKDKNIWVKTVTITASKSNSNSRLHTSVIAIGAKGVCHEEVEERFSNDLCTLSSGPPLLFFCRRRQEMVKVHAELWVSLQDQPERRGANCIDLGNSNMAARWGHSGRHALPV